MENKVIGPAIRQGIEQGVQQGIEQGVQQGIEQGIRQLVSRLLTTKFGPLRDRDVTRLNRASEAELMSWADRVLTARTLDEVFK